jgi:hypothetical protein
MTITLAKKHKVVAKNIMDCTSVSGKNNFVMKALPLDAGNKL